MRSLDAADLPRSIHLRDTSRRYQGLTYNCTAAPPLPKPFSRPEAPPLRQEDSAPATSPRPEASDKGGGTEAASTAKSM